MNENLRFTVFMTKDNFFLSKMNLYKKYMRLSMTIIDKKLVHIRIHRYLVSYEDYYFLYFEKILEDCLNTKIYEFVKVISNDFSDKEVLVINFRCVFDEVLERYKITHSHLKHSFAEHIEKSLRSLFT